MTALVCGPVRIGCSAKSFRHDRIACYRRPKQFGGDIRYHLGVVKTLALCAVLGLAWKMLT